MGELDEMWKMRDIIASKYHLFFHTLDKVRDHV